MALIDDLNSLTAKHLGVSPDDLGDPTALLSPRVAKDYNATSELDRALRTEMRNGVLKLENSVYGKGKLVQRKLSWRCLKCNTINGLQGGSYTKIRKRCSKCAQPRKNELTVEQELQIDFLIAEGLEYAEAREKVTSNAK